MSEIMNNRGGKREGAGRPKKDVCQKPMSLRLDPELSDVFDNNKTIKKNTFTNEAIREKMTKEGLL